MARGGHAWAIVAALLWLCAAPLRAQTSPDAGVAQDPADIAQPPLPEGTQGALEGQLTLDSGATCLERQKLISRVNRWRETTDVDPSLRVQVWGDPKVPTRVFFSVAREGVDPAERTLANAPADCDELHSAVALSIALAIDSLFAPSHPTPLAAAIEALESETRARDREPPFPRYGEVGLLVGATLSVVPSMAMAALPRVQFALLPWLAIALEGVATRAERLTFAVGPGYDATVLAIGLDGCVGGETAERMSFFVCVGARGGGFSTQGYGFGIGASESVTKPWWALAASSQARAWILPGFGIGIGIEALWTTAPRELVVESDSPMQAAQTQAVPRLGLAVSGGPVFRFF